MCTVSRALRTLGSWRTAAALLKITEFCECKNLFSIKQKNKGGIILEYFQGYLRIRWRGKLLTLPLVPFTLICKPELGLSYCFWPRFLRAAELSHICLQSVGALW